MPALLRALLCVIGLLFIVDLTRTVDFSTTVDLSIPFNETVAVHQEACFLGPDCKRMKMAFTAPKRFNTTAATLPKGNSGACCEPCSCENDCLTYGTCCLQKFNDFKEARHYSEKARAKCITPEYIVRKPRDYQSPYSRWMIMECNHEDLAEEIKQKCRNPVFDSSLESITPVIDASSNVTYRNVFCAQCNTETDQSNLKSWNINIVCDGVLQLPDENILSTMYQQNCSVMFNYTYNSEYSYCNKPLISSCNETGLWQDYDEITDLACNSFYNVFLKKYKNYFCYLCNTQNRTALDDFKCTDDIELHDFTPSFATIIDLDVIRRWENDEILYCDKQTQFEDYKLMQCRDIHCYASRYLSENICKNKEPSKDSFCYSVFLKVTPHALYRYDELKYESLFTVETFAYSIAKDIPFISDVVELVSTFLDEGSLKKKRVKYFFLHLLLNTTIYNNTDVLETFYRLYGEEPQKYFINGVDIYDTFVNILFSFSLTAYDLNINELNNLLMNESGVPVNGLDVVHVKQLGLLICIQKPPVTLTKIKICPYVILTLDELSMEIQNDILIVNITETMINVRDYEKHGDEIYLCIDDYKAINEDLPLMKIERTANTRIVVAIKDILSFICISLSIVCLLITIATYLYFKELQTQPGVNTVTMCINLLLAQGVFQFAVGQTSLPGWACSLIGAISHFLWLSVMFSMNVCSIQIYLTFLKSRQISPKYKLRQTVINTAYIGLASLFFVAINVIVSLARSNGHHIGYGGSICYLSSSIMHGVTFLMPSLLILSSNIVLFVSVILRISRITKATAILQQNKSYLLVFARLSALTGFTWILGLFKILFRTEVFEYLFIIFNASQGVFIMAAFILNKRVRSLFCPSIRGKKTKASTLRTMQSTISHS